jgi:hypothetical protein
VLSLFFKSGKPFETHPAETGAFYLMMLVYFNKDFVNARSIAKRILGLIIIDRVTGEPASELKCLLRNLTIPIWPLEVLISLFSRNRRLGDIIANTRIEITDKENPKAILGEFKNKRLTSNTLWTLVISSAFLTGLWYLMDWIIGI